METFHEDSERGLSPYVVKLDSGKEVYSSPYDNEWIIRKSKSGPMVVEFIIGERVECQLAYGGNEWTLGIVVEINENWEKRVGVAPYVIKFDNGGEERVYWGPQECIRASKAPLLSSTYETTNLRFRIGERVECNTDYGYLPGTVIRHWYGIEFDNDYTVPYQIQLDNGDRIYSPRDEDGYIRLSTVPAPDCWICFDNKQSESNIIIRDCACRGQGNGFVHLDCLTKLAISKTEHLGCNTPIGANDVNPFYECVTCKQQFDSSSCSRVALAEVCFAQHSSDHIGSWWNIEAIELMVESFIGNCDYEGAKKLLHTQMEKVQDLQDSAELEAYLSNNILLQLANVYWELGQLDEMKDALDKIRDFREENGQSINTSQLLVNFAKLAHVVGDKQVALKYYEKSAPLLVGDGNSYSSVLTSCAALNLELGDKDQCIDQLKTVLKINTTLYGKEHNLTPEIAHALRQVIEGSIVKLPLGKLGLGVLERNIRRLSKSM